MGLKERVAWGHSSEAGASAGLQELWLNCPSAHGNTQPSVPSPQGSFWHPRIPNLLAWLQPPRTGICPHTADLWGVIPRPSYSQGDAHLGN